MKVLCTKKSHAFGDIRYEGEVYEFPGDKLPPEHTTHFKILKSEKEVEDVIKKSPTERKKASEETLLEDMEKNELISQAHKLGIAAPSTLSRWGIDKLKEEIEKAQEA